MKRSWALIAPLFVVLALAPQGAQAGIPIPCTGEHVVSVVETPPAMRLPSRDGKGVHVNLGYLFQGCTSGKWVAYSGSGSNYYDLPEPVMALVLASAGLKEYPTPPRFLLTPSASWAAWLWIVIGAFVVIGTVLSKLAGIETVADANRPANSPAPSMPLPAPGARPAGNVVMRARPGNESGRSAFGKRS